ncbi:hypothetical protein [Bogoriella caseilytica]|nr:hypothetical protein [Bogoriella caseilytica]
MIIWRGWGILGVLPLMAFGLGVALWTEAFGFSGGPWLVSGPLAALAGAGVYLLGRELNVRGVPAKAHQMLAARRAERQHLVASGQFRLSPQHPAPRSLQEAQSQADELHQHEQAYLSQNLRNRHTFFFIPVQYVGLITAGIGVVMALFGVVENW